MWCRESLAPYGVDPVFKVGTTLYNPDLDNEDSMVSFYNCSELDFKPTYNTQDPDALVRHLICCHMSEVSAVSISVQHCC